MKIVNKENGFNSIKDLSNIKDKYDKYLIEQNQEFKISFIIEDPKHLDIEPTLTISEKNQEEKIIDIINRNYLYERNRIEDKVVHSSSGSDLRNFIHLSRINNKYKSLANEYLEDVTVLFNSKQNLIKNLFNKCVDIYEYIKLEDKIKKVKEEIELNKYGFIKSLFVKNDFVINKKVELLKYEEKKTEIEEVMDLNVFSFDYSDKYKMTKLGIDKYSKLKDVLVSEYFRDQLITEIYSLKNIYCEREVSFYDKYFYEENKIPDKERIKKNYIDFKENLSDELIIDILKKEEEYLYMNGIYHNLFETIEGIEDKKDNYDLGLKNICDFLLRVKKIRRFNIYDKKQIIYGLVKRVFLMPENQKENEYFKMVFEIIDEDINKLKLLKLDICDNNLKIPFCSELEKIFYKNDEIQKVVLLEIAELINKRKLSYEGLIKTVEFNQNGLEISFNEESNLKEIFIKDLNNIINNIEKNFLSEKNNNQYDKYGYISFCFQKVKEYYSKVREYSSEGEKKLSIMEKLDLLKKETKPEKLEILNKSLASELNMEIREELLNKKISIQSNSSDPVLSRSRKKI